MAKRRAATRKAPVKRGWSTSRLGGLKPSPIQGGILLAAAGLGGFLWWRERDKAAAITPTAGSSPVAGESYGSYSSLPTVVSGYGGSGGAMPPIISNSPPVSTYQPVIPVGYTPYQLADSGGKVIWLPAGVWETLSDTIQAELLPISSSGMDITNFVGYQTKVSPIFTYYVKAADVSVFSALFPSAPGTGTSVQAGMLIAPANGATSQLPRPAFQWTGNAPYMRFTLYDAAGTPADQRIFGSGVNSYTPGYDLLVGQQYHWGVEYSGDGQAWTLPTGASTYNFSTATASQAYNLGVKTSPANGATNVGIHPTYSWTGDAPYIWFGLVDGNGNVLYEQYLPQGTKSITPSFDLVAGQTYGWDVNFSRDNSVWTSPTDHWAFFTVAGGAPAYNVGGKVSPVNGATGVATQPTFTWNGDAPYIWIGIFDANQNLLFESTEGNQWGVHSRTINYNLTPGQTYKWGISFSPDGSTWNDATQGLWAFTVAG
jgi:hypothetical protein